MVKAILIGQNASTLLRCAQQDKDRWAAFWRPAERGEVSQTTPLTGSRRASGKLTSKVIQNLGPLIHKS